MTNSKLNENNQLNSRKRKHLKTKLTKSCALQKKVIGLTCSSILLSNWKVEKEVRYHCKKHDIHTPNYFSISTPPFRKFSSLIEFNQKLSTLAETCLGQLRSIRKGSFWTPIWISGKDKFKRLKTASPCDSLYFSKKFVPGTSKNSSKSHQERVPSNGKI